MDIKKFNHYFIVILAIFSIIFILKKYYFERKQETKPLCIMAIDSLDKNTLDLLKQVKTKNNVTLDKILKSGKENLDSSIGCYAGDAESYDKFEKLFNFVIKKYHGLDSFQENNNLKFEEKFTQDAKNLIKSTRIRVARNFAKFPFPSSMKKDQRILIENEMSNIFKNNKFFKEGNYYSLINMTEKEKSELIESHLLFKDMTKDRFIKSSGIADDFPVGRGIYISKNKNYIIWVNEEDHLRIISMKNDASINSVFENLLLIEKEISSQIAFAIHNKYGFLTSCPTNIGTGMRASVHIKLKNLGKDLNFLKNLAKKMNIDVRGEKGEHSDSPEMIFDISNKGRFGKSREEYLNHLVKSINLLVEIDKNIHE